MVMGRSQARVAVRGGGRGQVKGRGKEELGTDRLMIWSWFLETRQGEGDCKW